MGLFEIKSVTGLCSGATAPSRNNAAAVGVSGDFPPMLAVIHIAVAFYTMWRK
jgi:hypothetical protein